MMEPKVTILLNKKVSEVGPSCPKATVDIKENVKNRDWTIKNFGYGPLNPDFPDPGFLGEQGRHLENRRGDSQDSALWQLRCF